MNRDAEPEWSALEEVRVKIGEKFFVNDYVSVLDKVERINQLPGLMLSGEDIAVKASIKLEGEHETFFVEPLFLIKNGNEVGRVSSETGELGVKITLLNIHPATNEFSLGLQTRQKDWVIIKAMEKPYINILWLGTGLMMLGFTTAMVRRIRENKGDVKYKSGVFQ